MSSRAFVFIVIILAAATLNAQSSRVENDVLSAALKCHFSVTQMYVKTPVVIAASTNALAAQKGPMWSEAARASFDNRNSHPLAVSLADLPLNLAVMDISPYETPDGFDWRRFRSTHPETHLVRLARPGFTAEDAAFVRLDITRPDGVLIAPAYVLVRSDNVWRVVAGELPVRKAARAAN